MAITEHSQEKNFSVAERRLPSPTSSAERAHINTESASVSRRRNGLVTTVDAFTSFPEKPGSSLSLVTVRIIQL